MPAAMHTATEGVGPGRLRDKLDRFRFAFFDLDTVLRRGKHQARVTRLGT